MKIVCIIAVYISVTLELSWANQNSMDIRASPHIIKTRILYSSGSKFSFTNVPALIEKQESRLGIKYKHLCAKGPWLLYENPNYLSNANGLNGISLLATKSHKCYSLKDEIGPLGSAQPITGQNHMNSRITFFRHKNFVGPAMPVGERVKPANKSPVSGSVVKSLITLGKYKWTVVFSDGTRWCITPVKASESSVCFLSNLDDDERVMEILRVRLHCPKEKPSETIELTECYEIGQGLVRPLNPTWAFGPPAEENTTDTASNDEKLDECERFNKNPLTKEQQGLVEARLTGNLGSGNWMQAIKTPSNIWKTEIFDKCIQIFRVVCNAKVIEKEYMILFVSLYFLQLSKAWEADNVTEVQFSEVEWMEIHNDLDTCLESVETGTHNNISELIGEGLKNYESLQDITDKIDKVLGVRPNYDHVMEINWHVANTVAAVCHDIHKNKVNFVTRFWNAYHPLYFTPILDQWATNEDAKLVYKYILGGYSMQKSLAKIGLCNLATMLHSHQLKPYPRPMEQTKEIFLPK